MSTLSIALINDTQANSNLGCQLTSGSLKRNLVTGLKNSGITATISSIPWKERPYEELGTIASTVMYRGGNQINDLTKKIALRQYGSLAIQVVADADIVVFQPEGSISDGHGPLRILRFLSLPVLASSILKKRLFVLNGTFPLTRTNRYQEIEAFLASSEFSAMRDRLSAEHFGVAFLPDSAFTYTAPEPAPIRERTHILITTGAALTVDQNVALAKKALSICRTLGLTPLVLTKDAIHLESVRSAVNNLGGAFINAATVEKAEGWIRKCRMHIGGRYHMAIFAACLDIPSVLVETNTHKNRWLGLDVEGIITKSSVSDLDPEKIVTVTKLFGYGDILGEVGRIVSIYERGMESVVTKMCMRPHSNKSEGAPVSEIMSPPFLRDAAKSALLEYSAAILRRFPF